MTDQVKTVMGRRLPFAQCPGIGIFGVFEGQSDQYGAEATLSA
jgi:hypothetical protein